MGDFYPGLGDTALILICTRNSNAGNESSLLIITYVVNGLLMWCGNLLYHRYFEHQFLKSQD